MEINRWNNNNLNTWKEIKLLFSQLNCIKHKHFNRTIRVIHIIFQIRVSQQLSFKRKRTGLNVNVCNACICRLFILAHLHASATRPYLRHYRCGARVFVCVRGCMCASQIKISILTEELIRPTTWPRPLIHRLMWLPPDTQERFCSILEFCILVFVLFIHLFIHLCIHSESSFLQFT